MDGGRYFMMRSLNLKKKKKKKKKHKFKFRIDCSLGNLFQFQLIWNQIFFVRVEKTTNCLYK